MVLITVKCPRCGGTNISKKGKTPAGTQKCLCSNKESTSRSFLLDYTYNGCKLGIDEQIIEMTANASGLRDTSGILKISKQKVADTLKKHKIQ